MTRHQGLVSGTGQSLCAVGSLCTNVQPETQIQPFRGERGTERGYLVITGVYLLQISKPSRLLGFVQYVPTMKKRVWAFAEMLDRLSNKT